MLGIVKDIVSLEIASGLVAVNVRRYAAKSIVELFDCDNAIGDVTVNKGCLVASEFIVVVENTASLLRAELNSRSVFKDDGAESIQLFIAAVT